MAAGEPIAGRLDGYLFQGVIADAALDGSRPWLPVPEALRLAGELARRPQRLMSRLAGHAVELARIGVGVSEIEPAADRRFRDPAWTENPAFCRLAQSYLAWCRLAEELIRDGSLDSRTERRVRLAAANVLAALAPTNHPLLNPTVLKAALDTGGLSLGKGAVNLTVDGLRPGAPPRLPALVDPGAFAVGESLAITPGAVVARTEMWELLQYRPVKPTVCEHPLVVVPSTINRYYIFDLAPRRSAIEAAVAAGHQVFAVSWRNPESAHACWDLEAYAKCVVDVLDTVAEITETERAHLAGLCAGGLITTVAMAHLSATGHGDRVVSATFVVSTLDFGSDGDLGAVVDRRSAELAISASARRGFVDGEALAGVFAWLRPEDRIWRHWIHNYLLGRDPVAHDILFWNADTVNLAAGLHRDLLRLAINDNLTQPGGLVRLGTALDVSKVTCDAFFVAGRRDHLTPWESAFRSALLFAGRRHFALVDSGHVTSVVSVPGDRRASYWSCPINDGDAPEAWLAAAAARSGSWWPEWLAWLKERGGSQRRARRRLGSQRYPPICPAPGTYVLS